MKWPHRISWILSLSTLGLIYIGGLVTSTHSALAVPDWPLSYGQFMPPMVGGILFEHGHRIVATLVGMLSIIAVIIFSLKESRGWLKKMVWLALFLVILQGVLGGLTVLFRIPWFISASHGTLAQTFFALTVSLVVWTSMYWKNNPPQRKESISGFPLHQLSLALSVVLLLQLIIGALLRHTGYLLVVHIVGAVTIIGLAGWMHLRIWQNYYEYKPLRNLSFFLVALVLFQIMLGLTTLILLLSTIKNFSHPYASAAVISLHVVTGAAIMGLSVALTLLVYKTKPEGKISLKTKMTDYLTLTKPGISFMAGITALAGFVLGSQGQIDLFKLFHTTVGTLLIAAGAGTLNMLVEKKSDSQMKRTMKRPIPSGRMNDGEALLLGAALSVSAIVYLSLAVNPLTALVAGLTLSIYLYVYTPMKKVSSFCTVVGAVAGALPPVIGWAAATNRIGLEAWVLFGIIFCWQFPHFFSLAWIYRDDYTAGGLHMLPGRITAFSMVVYSVGLLVVSVLPTFMGMTGVWYLFTAVAMGVGMTMISIIFLLEQTPGNARRIFFASLIYVPILVIFMVLNRTAGI